MRQLLNTITIILLLMCIITLLAASIIVFYPANKVANKATNNCIYYEYDVINNDTIPVDTVYINNN